MRLPKPALRHLVSLFIFILMCPSWRTAAQTANVPARITQAIDEKNLVTLKGNVHPLARPEFDQGPVADAQPLRRMLLLLQRSADQETALRQFLDDQQSKSSPNYHAWLTPDQFGKQFGPADADIQTVSQWLTSQGFMGIHVGPGRTVMEFSGNVAQVRTAFHTEIHHYLVAGEAHVANASDPQIPLALAPVVAGIVSLHSFRPTSHLLQVGTFHRLAATGEVRPLFTPLGSSNFFPLGPADFAKIYNVTPLLSATPPTDGTGQTIAIVGETNINVQDIAEFRTMFALPQNFSTSNVILNGPDPGINGNETESDLDVEWAGAVAPGATVDLVTSAPTETTSGVHLSALYIVDHNLAAVMSESFGECEQSLGAVGNQFFNLLWEQAAAQGITVVLSSGDGGSAGCDNFNTQQVASKGLAVSGFASTPFNVAVGGTDFDQANNWSQYWNTTNDPVTQASVKGYIPEIPWNDSCAQLGIAGCGASAPLPSLNIVAGSGGPSTIYPKPAWQSGLGVPSDNKRDLPDVSLFASNGFTGSIYIICQSDQVTIPGQTCSLSIFGVTFQGVGGTSASAPAFAGLMALVNQRQASAQNPAPRQGNANYVLYALAKAQANATPALNCNSSARPAAGCTFNDITKGNSSLPNGSVGIGTNSVPCAGASTNCSSGASGVNGVLVDPANQNNPAWSTTVGYDMVTGLGSVNAQNLINNWASANRTSTSTTLTLNNNSAGPISHGTSVPVQVKVTPGGATGDISLIADLGSGNTVPFGLLTLAAGGTASGNTASLPGGANFSVHAHYEGDGINAPSDSNSVSVTVSPESSKTLISIPTFDPNTGSETGNIPASVLYGTPYIARIDVGTAQAVLSFPPKTVCLPPACPSGTITWTDSLNGGPATPLDAGILSLNSAGFAEDQVIQLSGGSHVLSASYGGDGSFSPSSSSYLLTVTPVATTIQSGNPPLPTRVVTPFGIGVTVRTNSSGAMPSCNMTFFEGNTPVPGTLTCSGQHGGATFGAFLQPSLIVSQTTSGTHTYTAKFDGDANYTPSTSAPMTTSVFLGTTTSLSINPTTVQYGSPINLTALVDSFQSNGPSLSDQVSFDSATGTITYTPAKDASGNVALQATLSFIPQGSGWYFASFAGDSVYGSSGSNSVFVTVNIPDFSLTVNPTTLPVTAGQSGVATVSVMPASNAPSPVTFSCEAGVTPPGASCSFSPSTVTLSNGSIATTTLTLNTLPPSSSPTVTSVPLMPPRDLHYFDGWRLLSLAAAAAVLILMNFPQRFRPYRFAIGLASVSIFAFVMGCGGSGGFSSVGGGGGGGGGSAPAPTTIALTTSGVKVPFGTGLTLSAKITSSNTVGGTVTFLIDSTTSGDIANVVNGTAQVQDMFSVGVHAITAKYSGDANNLPSQTAGSLNVAVTGNASVVIFGTTGSRTNQVALPITIQ